MSENHPKCQLRESLAKIYKLEQNVSLTSFFDSGWELKLGNPISGLETWTALTLEEVETILENLCDT